MTEIRGWLHKFRIHKTLASSHMYYIYYIIFLNSANTGFYSAVAGEMHLQNWIKKVVIYA